MAGKSHPGCPAGLKSLISGSWVARLCVRSLTVGGQLACNPPAARERHPSCQHPWNFASRPLETGAGHSIWDCVCQVPPEAAVRSPLEPVIVGPAGRNYCCSPSAHPGAAASVLGPVKHTLVPHAPYRPSARHTEITGQASQEAHPTASSHSGLKISAFSPRCRCVGPSSVAACGLACPSAAGCVLHRHG